MNVSEDLSSSSKDRTVSVRSLRAQPASLLREMRRDKATDVSKRV
jgi:hypothetical protein